MSFHYEVNGDKVIFNFERKTTLAFGELLQRTEGEECQIGSPLVADKLLTGYIDEVAVVPIRETKYANSSWVVEVELKDVLADVKEDEELCLPQNISYVMSNMVMGKPVFTRTWKVSLTQSTNYECFSDLVIPPIDRASTSYDHKTPIEKLLFEREDKVMVKLDFTEMPWAESSLDGASILIPTSKKKENGNREYTELGLAEDGWTYSSDLTTDTEYKEYTVEEAMKLVQNTVVNANHNP